MTELKLNDFEGFNKVLFGDHEPDWSKFYDKDTDVFMPPIEKPINLAENQLCHYALWMVISAFCLDRKPVFYYLSRHYIPFNRCYPCDWHIEQGSSCKQTCPLILDDDYNGCGTAFDKWKESPIDVKVQAAEVIARYHWREV